MRADDIADHAGRTLVEAAGDLTELIEAHADDGERLRRLPMPTVRATFCVRLMTPAEAAI